MPAVSGGVTEVPATLGRLHRSNVAGNDCSEVYVRRALCVASCCAALQRNNYTNLLTITILTILYYTKNTILYYINILRYYSILNIV